MPEARMSDHFSNLAPAYRDLRTTDEAPALFIRDALAGRRRLRAADVGCGAGRYDLVLFRHLPGLRLVCVDGNADMLAELSDYLRGQGITDFETVTESVEGLELEAESFDAVCTFNAVHHFDFPLFLAKAGRALKPSGFVFVYTRTPEQNAQSVWGRYFPGFRQRETRLHGLDRMTAWVAAARGLKLVEAKTFSYSRTASLDRLLEQARGRHYSTFSLYGEAEFEDACAAFAAELRRSHADIDRIEWRDQNTLLQIARAS